MNRDVFVPTPIFRCQLLNQYFDQEFAPLQHLNPKFAGQSKQRKCEDRYVPTNILRDEDGFEIRLAIPGLDRELMEIMIEKNILSVSAKKGSSSDERKFNLKQFDYSNFTKRFELSEGIDKENIEADYKQGILSIKLPLNKKEETTIQHKVEIK